MKTRSCYGLAMLALIAGCVYTNVAPLDLTAVRRPPTCQRAVILYTAKDRVPGPFEELALLNSGGMSGWTNEAGMVTSMRQKAASLGASAVLLDEIVEPSAGAKVAGAIFGTGSERKGKATAIYVIGDSTRIQQTCGPWQFTDADGLAWTATMTDYNRTVTYRTLRGDVRTANMPTDLSLNSENIALAIVNAKWNKRVKR